MTAGHQPESRRQIPWENSLLTSGKGLLGQRDLSAYLERGFRFHSFYSTLPLSPRLFSKPQLNLDTNLPRWL